ncbi:MAG: hypothetical protein ABIH66_12950 [bacterium]
MNQRAASKIQAGAAAVDISPERLDRRRIWMSGFSPFRYATEQADPIEARALALGGDGGGIVIVVVDTCLISPLMAGRWARRISREVPVPPHRVFIVTTHTHSGPDFSWLFRGVPLSYYFSAREGIVRAARMAWEARRPATLRAGTAEHNLGLPRRKNWGQKTLDREMVVLQWRSGRETVATLINLGCHGVVYPKTSTVLSSDLPGALCRAADAEFGGVSLFAPRIQGDVNPDLPGKNAYEQEGNAEELARLAGHGREKIIEAVKTAKKIDASPIAVEGKKLKLKVRNPLSFIPLWAGRPRTRLPAASIASNHFRLGGIEGITIPGEALTCLGMRLLERLPRPALLFSYTGGYHGYLMTRKTYRRGGYEALVSPGPVDPESFFG